MSMNVLSTSVAVGSCVRAMTSRCLLLLALLLLPHAQHVVAAQEGWTVEFAEGEVVLVGDGAEARKALSKGDRLPAAALVEVGEGRLALASGGPDEFERMVLLLGSSSRVEVGVVSAGTGHLVRLVDGSMRAVQDAGGRAPGLIMVGAKSDDEKLNAPPVHTRGGDVMVTWNDTARTGTLYVQRGQVEVRSGARRIVFRPMMARDLRVTGPSGARSIGPSDWALMVETVAIDGVPLPGVAAAAAPARAAGAATADSQATAEAVTPAFEYFRMETSLGNIVLELDGARAPVSTANFGAYVDARFYEGTIFHRVVRTGISVIQGGGFTADMQPKPGTLGSITNEWQNGLTNSRGSIAMARTALPNSATSQFYINTVHNRNLDRPDQRGAAYAVFGRVVSGMDVVDAIQAVPTETRGRFGDVPVTSVVINRVVRLTDEEVAELDLERPRE